MTITSIAIEKDDLKKIKDIALKNGTSMRALFNQAIRRIIEAYEKED